MCEPRYKIDVADLLTLADVARQLRIGQRTVRRLVAKQHLRCIYVGLDGDGTSARRRMRFTQAHVDEFVAARGG